MFDRGDRPSKTKGNVFVAAACVFEDDSSGDSVGVSNDASHIDMVVVSFVGVSKDTELAKGFDDFDRSQESIVASGREPIDTNRFISWDIESKGSQEDGNDSFDRTEERVARATEFADGKIRGAFVETKADMDFGNEVRMGKSLFVGEDLIVWGEKGKIAGDEGNGHVSPDTSG